MKGCVDRDFLKYKSYLFNYGIITVLKLLNHYIEIEEYEECSKIVAAIDERNKALDDNLPKELTENTYKIVLDFFNKKEPKININWLEEKTDYYRDMILQKKL